MSGLGQINIKFAADLKGFSTAMQNSSRKLQKFGKQMQNVGRNLSIGLTVPLTAFAAVSLKNFDKQDKAVAQLNAGLKSSGRFTEELSKKLQDQASVLQNNSLFGDEDILANATAQILTFTNISVDKIADVNLASANLATRLGTDLKSASIQLGKALNDPITNLSALSRSGIQFSESQKSTIKALVETNRIGEAQSLILAELETQYGNSAKAASLAGLGGLKQLSNSFGDLQEEVGGVLAGAILPFVDTLKGVVASFQALSPETKKWIVILGGVSAAVGPILALAGTILPAVLTGFGLLISPIGLIVAGLTAVGVVILKNWAPIKAQLVKIANYFIDLYNESSLFKIAVESVVLTFKNLWSVGKFVLSGIGSLLSNLGQAFVLNVEIMGKALKAVLTNPLSAADALKNLFSDLASGAITTFAKTSASLSNDWSDLLINLEENTATAMANISSRAKITLLKENIDTSVLSEIPPINIPVALGVPVLGKTNNKESDKENSSSVLGLASNLDKENEKVGGVLDSMKGKFDAFQENSQTIGQAIGGVFSNMGNSISNSLGLAASGFQGFLRELIAGVVKMIAVYLAQSKAAAVAGATTSAAASGPAAIFTLPGFIAAALTAVVSSFSGIPAFADGGIMGGTSFSGDKLFARINSGEMVLNQRQQRNVAGLIGAGSGQNVEVVLQPSIDFVGDKFRVMLNKVDQKFSRRK